MLKSKLNSLSVIAIGKGGGEYFIKGDRILKMIPPSIHLDKTMVFPSPIIAEGLLYEWKEGLNSNAMPTIASMTSRSLDMYYERELYDSVKNDIVKRFIMTDSLCFVDGNFDETRIAKIISILSKIETSLGFPKKTLLLSNSFYANPITELNQSKIISSLPSFSLSGCYQLASLEQIALSSKSILIPLAIWLDLVSKEEAIDLIGMENDIQSERWGLLEDYHTPLRYKLLKDINASYLFLNLKE